MAQSLLPQTFETLGCNIYVDGSVVYHLVLRCSAVGVIMKDFGTQEYWDKFFIQQDEKAFEWYGSYGDLEGVVSGVVSEHDRVLVIGCGNSDFSTDMYLQGHYHHITNIDFSSLVIEEMRAKTRETCPSMQWTVMDVTKMDFLDGEWDVVVDKGTLDAIFNTEDSAPQVVRMLSEVKRVLSPQQGRYMVVTLGQDFILRHLLQTFIAQEGDQEAWDVVIRSFTNSQSSTYLGLVVTATRRPPTPTGSPGESRVEIHVDSMARACDVPALSRPLETSTVGEVMTAVAQAQRLYRIKHEIQRSVVPGRFVGGIDLWGAGKEDLPPRYTLKIVDVVPGGPHPLTCGVFLIPQGRDHEWIFATEDGLKQVAESASYRRLICINMNRGHEFQGYTEVKEELSGLIMDFVPLERPSGETIPFLADGDSIGSRHVVETGELPFSGKYNVEEVTDEDIPGAKVRLLVFLSNQHIIQSETRLIPAPSGQVKGASVGKKKHGGSNKKKGGGKSSSSKAQTQEEPSPSPSSSLVVDYRHLAFDYHRAMLAAMALLYSSLRQARMGGSHMRALVIGLGGGALPLFLRRYFPPLDVHVVELDGSVVDVAKRCFLFAEEDAPEEGGAKRLGVTVGDGLEVVRQEAEAGVAYDAIFVDVDNKDVSQGMSCPSPAFLTPAFLGHCRALLSRSPDQAPGMMVMNLAARSKSMLESSLRAFQAAFTAAQPSSETEETPCPLYELKPCDYDVNRVLMALTRPRVAPAKRSSLGLLMEKWLEEAKPDIGSSSRGGGNDVDDPLELGELASKIVACVPRS